MAESQEEDEKCQAKFQELQKFVPFLHEVIEKLKLQNEQSDHNSRQGPVVKFLHLLDLITNNKKKLKWGALIKCEEVLIKLKSKMERKVQGSKKKSLLQRDSEKVGTSGERSLEKTPPKTDQKAKSKTESKQIDARNSLPMENNVRCEEKNLKEKTTNPFRNQSPRVSDISSKSHSPEDKELSLKPPSISEIGTRRPPKMDNIKTKDNIESKPSETNTGSLVSPFELVRKKLAMIVKETSVSPLPSPNLSSSTSTGPKLASERVALKFQLLPRLEQETSTLAKDDLEHISGTNPPLPIKPPLPTNASLPKNPQLPVSTPLVGSASLPEVNKTSNPPLKTNLISISGMPSANLKDPRIRKQLANMNVNSGANVNMDVPRGMPSPVTSNSVPSHLVNTSLPKAIIQDVTSLPQMIPPPKLAINLADPRKINMQNRDAPQANPPPAVPRNIPVWNIYPGFTQNQKSPIINPNKDYYTWLATRKTQSNQQNWDSDLETPPRAPAAPPGSNFPRPQYQGGIRPPNRPSDTRSHPGLNRSSEAYAHLPPQRPSVSYQAHYQPSSYGEYRRIKAAEEAAKKRAEEAARLISEKVAPKKSMPTEPKTSAADLQKCRTSESTLDKLYRTSHFTGSELPKPQMTSFKIPKKAKIEEKKADEILRSADNKLKKDDENVDKDKDKEKLHSSEEPSTSHEEINDESSVNTVSSKNIAGDHQESNEKKILETVVNDLLNSNHSRQKVMGFLKHILSEEKIKEIAEVLDKHDKSGLTKDTEDNEEKNENNQPSETEMETEAETTSCSAAPVTKRGSTKGMKRRNELDRLNEDIRGMFISEGVITATGKRMCTLVATADKDATLSTPTTKNATTTKATTPTVKNSVKTPKVTTPSTKASITTSESTKPTIKASIVTPKATPAMTKVTVATPTTKSTTATNKSGKKVSAPRIRNTVAKTKKVPNGEELKQDSTPKAFKIRRLKVLVKKCVIQGDEKAQKNGDEKAQKNGDDTSEKKGENFHEKEKGKRKLETEEIKESRKTKNLAEMFQKSDDGCTLSTQNIITVKRRTRTTANFNEVQQTRAVFKHTGDEKTADTKNDHNTSTVDTKANLKKGTGKEKNDENLSQSDESTVPVASANKAVVPGKSIVTAKTNDDPIEGDGTVFTFPTVPIKRKRGRPKSSVFYSGVCAARKAAYRAKVAARMKEKVDSEHEDSSEEPSTSHEEINDESSVNTVSSKNIAGDHQDSNEKKILETVVHDLLNSNHSRQKVMGFLKHILSEEKIKEIAEVLDKHDKSGLTKDTEYNEEKNENNQPSETEMETEAETTSCSAALVTKRGSTKGMKRRNDLDLLNEDIRGMFISEGVITATGKRIRTSESTKPTIKASIVSPKATPAMTKVTVATPTTKSTTATNKSGKKVPAPRIRNTVAKTKKVPNAEELKQDSTPKAFKIRRLKVLVKKCVSKASRNNENKNAPTKSGKKIKVSKGLQDNGESSDDKKLINNKNTNDKIMNPKPCPKSKKKIDEHEEVESLIKEIKEKFKATVKEKVKEKEINPISENKTEGSGGVVKDNSKITEDCTVDLTHTHCGKLSASNSNLFMPSEKTPSPTIDEFAKNLLSIDHEEDSVTTRKQQGTKTMTILERLSQKIEMSTTCALSVPAAVAITTVSSLPTETNPTTTTCTVATVSTLSTASSTLATVTVLDNINSSACTSGEFVHNENNEMDTTTAETTNEISAPMVVININGDDDDDSWEDIEVEETHSCATKKIVVKSRYFPKSKPNIFITQTFSTQYTPNAEGEMNPTVGFNISIAPTIASATESSSNSTSSPASSFPGQIDVPVNNNNTTTATSRPAFKCMAQGCKYQSRVAPAMRAHLIYHQNESFPTQPEYLLCSYCSHMAETVDEYISHTEEEHLTNKNNVKATESLTQKMQSILRKGNTSMGPVKKTYREKLVEAITDIVAKTGLKDTKLYRCVVKGCESRINDEATFFKHIRYHLSVNNHEPNNCKISCPHCDAQYMRAVNMKTHIRTHACHNLFCYMCSHTENNTTLMQQHYLMAHSHTAAMNSQLLLENENNSYYVVYTSKLSPEGVQQFGERLIAEWERNKAKSKTYFNSNEIDLLPLTPIWDYDVHCIECGTYKTKVRSNMRRHLAQHKASGASTANGGPTNQTGQLITHDPINPMPCLNKNEKYFDKMKNLASSSLVVGSTGGAAATASSTSTSSPSPPATASVPNGAGTSQASSKIKYALYDKDQRYTCGVDDCGEVCKKEKTLRQHIIYQHANYGCYRCNLCCEIICKGALSVKRIIHHTRFHESKLYQCQECLHIHYMKSTVQHHIRVKHANKQVELFTYVRKSNGELEGTILKEVIKGKNFVLSLLAEQKPTEESPAAPEKPGPQSKLEHYWQCNMCPNTFQGQNQMIEHCKNVHGCQDQYFCMHCSFSSNLLEPIIKHMNAKHVGGRQEVRANYQKKTITFTQAGGAQTRPLWLRDDPQRIRHIRGILIEDEEAAENRKRLRLDLDDDDGLEQPQIPEDAGKLNNNTTAGNGDQEMTANKRNANTNDDNDDDDDEVSIVGGTDDDSTNKNNNAVRISIYFRFSCFHCPITTTSFDLMRHHWNVMHNNTKNAEPFFFKCTQLVKCLVCLKYVGSTTDMKQHLEEEHSTKDFLAGDLNSKQNLIFCAFCHYKCGSFRRILAHYRTAGHNMEDDLKNLEEVLNHLTKISINNAYQLCLECSEVFPSPTATFQHGLVVHPDKRNIAFRGIKGQVMYRCGFCKFVSTIEIETLRHMIQHNPDFENCFYCKSPQENFIKYMQHLSSQHPNASSFACIYPMAKLKSFFLKIVIIFPNGFTVSRRNLQYTHSHLQSQTDIIKVCNEMCKVAQQPPIPPLRIGNLRQSIEASTSNTSPMQYQSPNQSRSTSPTSQSADSTMNALQLANSLRPKPTRVQLQRIFKRPNTIAYKGFGNSEFSSLDFEVEPIRKKTRIDEINLINDDDDEQVEIENDSIIESYDLDDIIIECDVGGQKTLTTATISRSATSK